MVQSNGTCRVCGRRTVSSYWWFKNPPPEREALKEAGYARFGGSGLCHRCLDAAARRRRGERENRMGDTECLVCGRLLVAASVWWATPLSERAEMNLEGYSMHGSKGMCARCYRRAFYAENGR